jgi:hypothetical protein
MGGIYVEMGVLMRVKRKSLCVNECIDACKWEKPMC